MTTWFEALRLKVSPTAAFFSSVLQAAGFVLWYHDYVGVESLVVTSSLSKASTAEALFQISGPSMLPTFNHPRLSGDIVLTECFTSWLPGWVANLTWLPAEMRSWALNVLPQFEKGDVVLAYSPIELNKRICKRLVAEEGDVVRIPMDGSALQGKTLIIPEGHVWLEGDCPRVSRDCRDYGPIPKALLHGRPWFQVWPVNRFGPIRNKRG